ncbi:MAG: hypothetical protein P9X24_16135 [Candidatus Hatepunaea meridiana]|nr:hypothetical protein [Candidatus Hatepunaea meridiana]
MGVGRRSTGQVAMISGAVPGDKIEVNFEITKGKGIAFGKLISILVPSEHRIPHPCDHYSAGCRGSLFGAYDYTEGLTLKRNHLINALKRIGKLEEPVVNKILPSPEKWNYRDRLEFQLQIESDQLRIGFVSSDTVIPIKNCCLGVKSIQSSLQRMWEDIPQIKPNTQVEDFRILLRDNGKGESIAILFTKTESQEHLDIIRQLLKAGNFTGWEIRLVRNFDSRFFSSRLIDRFGDNSLHVEIGDNTIELQPLAFTQSNRSASGLLRRSVTDLIPDGGKLLDFYGGYGAFALEYLQNKTGSAVVLESSKPVVTSGRKFVKSKRLPIRFLQIDLSKLARRDIPAGQYDSAILDPPRNGLHKIVIDYLNTTGPRQVIYVSCHAAALARDLRELTGYIPDYFIPIDMFPNTSELETIAVLQRTDSE